MLVLHFSLASDILLVAVKQISALVVKTSQF